MINEIIENENSNIINRKDKLSTIDDSVIDRLSIALKIALEESKNMPKTNRYKNYFGLRRRFSVNEFIEFALERKSEYTRYCEICIDDIGYIELVRPSHHITLMFMVAKKYNILPEQYEETIPERCTPLYWIISKEKFLAVWYNRAIIPESGLNRLQKRTINLLIKNGLLSEDITYSPTNEYKNHLEFIKTMEGK